MRSLAFTLVLAACCTALAGLAGWRLAHGDLAALLGAPPVQPGHRLYPRLQAAEVVKIRIETFGGDAEFVKTANGWMAVAPWQDRMDPNAATDIIAFTIGLRVEDFAPVEETSLAEAGLTDQHAVAIRLEGADGQPLAKYRLGRRTPWMVEGAAPDEKSGTVFVRPMDKNRKDYVFVCAGDILAQFRNNLAFLRDHHPFFFHPGLLREIHIKNKEGELTLARATPESAWRITKPLELPTNPQAVANLINNLGRLAAVSVTDQPTGEEQPANGERRISLASFHSAEPAVLTVNQPASPMDEDAPATVSDRPGALFMLPLKPERNLISLADVHATVNSLRDPQLLHLNRNALQAIIIQPANAADIYLKRDAPLVTQAPASRDELERVMASSRWTTRVDGEQVDANATRLDALLTALEKLRALSFESDAASDFAPWGLDRPALRLTFVAWDAQTITLRFGFNKSGMLFANRLGSPSVMGVDPAILGRIAANPFEWKPANPWAVSKVHVTAIERTVPGQPPLALKTNFVTERWTGSTADGTDVTPRIIFPRANHLLGGLDALTVARWLAPDDADATAALTKPSLVLKVTSVVDEDTPAHHDTLTLAPYARSGYYCARVEGEPYPFLIDPGTYERLAIDPLERE